MIDQRKQRAETEPLGRPGPGATTGGPAPAGPTAPTEGEPGSESRELTWDDVPPVDIIGLEVGYGLIPLVDRNQGGQLMNRIKGVRKKLSQELGFLVQSVHIRDNLDLPPNQYRISLSGVPVGEAEVMPNRELAINPGTVYGTVQGVAAKDPAFGLEAVWVEAGQKDHAQTLGYTVVDSATVIATHLSQILQQNSHQLLGHDEVQKLLDVLARTAPKLVEDLVPNALPLGTVVKVLQNLLREGVPIRDIRRIAESLAEIAPRSQDPGALTTHVRASLGRLIVQHIRPELPVVTLDPSLERILQQTAQNDSEAVLGLEPGMAESLHKSLINVCQQLEAKGEPAVLLVSPPLRAELARWIRHSIPSLFVLSYNEVPDDKQIRLVSTIGNTAPA